MTAASKITILLHEDDRYPLSIRHSIWALCDVWRERGIEIEVLKGTKCQSNADLLIPIIDLTRTPQDYIDFLNKHPRVINRDVHDISKRRISRNLLTQSDDYTGPVVIKTDSNCGGMPDFRRTRAKVAYKQKSFWGKLTSFHKRRESHRWSKVNCINPQDYQIFPSLAEVPKEIFSNPFLIAEKFLPEYEDGVYYLRIYTFIGDREHCLRIGSSSPIVKGENMVSREEVAIPPEVQDFRREIKMDYGKLDFVIHEGRVVILDVTSTPGHYNNPEQMRINSLMMADGIFSLLK